MQNQLIAASDYLESDRQRHMLVSGRWRLDAGKLETALQLAGLAFCSGGDCEVFSRDTLDGKHAVNFPKPWIVQSDEGQFCFDTETEACAFRRGYRIAKGLDPYGKS